MPDQLARGLKLGGAFGQPESDSLVLQSVASGEADFGIGFMGTQVPEVEGAFVSLDPNTGEIRSLVGGFDYAKNKFNHVTQAWRQPGSSFKPFIYSAALERGFTAATVVNDAPLFFDAGATGSQPWEPKNYDGKFDGPMRMRQALAKSKNMVSIRILQSIGPRYAQDYITRFGFDPKLHPPYLTMALLSAAPEEQKRNLNLVLNEENGGTTTRAYIFTKDVSGRYLYVNEQVRQLFGVPLEQIIGRVSVNAIVNPVTDQTIVKENVTRVEMFAAIQEFGKAIEGADAALFFYAGHAMQFKDRNYLIPIDIARRTTARWAATARPIPSPAPTAPT